MNADGIAIRSLQHYLYCPHRWGLCEIEGLWLENAFTSGADLLHQRVHNPDKNYTLRNAKVYTSVKVYNDDPELMLYGVLDCLEAIPDKNGVLINGVRCQLNIVEYKPTKPEGKDYTTPDLIQLFAQKLCCDNVFGYDCGTDFYYANVKKRVKVDFHTGDMYTENLTKIKLQIAEMQGLLRSRTVPPISVGQKCSGCSMNDICVPKTANKETVRQRIKELIAET